ncbi:7709_t:CDS:1, partial [Racocetra persica]
MVKHTRKTNEKISNKKAKTDNKTLTQQSNTLERFFTISKVSNKEKVKRIWDDLNDEKKFLLEDEFAQMYEDWLYLLKDELVSKYYLNIKRQIASLKGRGINVLPQRNLRFRCFKTSLFDISVVIVGQDPYPNDADGLAFSSETIKPSLKKIFNLLEWDIEDMKWSRPKIGSLQKWSKNILLLNSILTVERENLVHIIDWDSRNLLIRLLS